MDPQRQPPVKRALISSLLGLVVISGVIGGAAWLRSVRAADRHVIRGQVPNMVGLRQRDAVKALAAAGLIAEVRIDSEAPNTGKVLSSVPEAHEPLAPGSSVLLFVAWEPPRPPPPPGVNPEERYTELGGFVEGHPEIFVGYYIDEHGDLVIVFDPGVDIEAWRQRLEPHLGKGNEHYRTESCSHSLGELQRIAYEIEPNDFPHKIAYSGDVEPETCTVRITSDQLTHEDIRALSERFGTVVSFETTDGSHPERA